MCSGIKHVAGLVPDVSIDALGPIRLHFKPRGVPAGIHRGLGLPLPWEGGPGGPNNRGRKNLGSDRTHPITPGSPTLKGRLDPVHPQGLVRLRDGAGLLVGAESKPPLLHQSPRPCGRALSLPALLLTNVIVALASVLPPNAVPRSIPENAIAFPSPFPLHLHDYLLDLPPPPCFFSHCGCSQPPPLL